MGYRIFFEQVFLDIGEAKHVDDVFYAVIGCQGGAVRAGDNGLGIDNLESIICSSSLLYRFR